jgi:hypothetical protein
MMEGSPQTPEEIRRLNRDLMEKIIDKAASDPAWKQRLLDDPEAVIAEAGFPEARQLRQMQASAELPSEEEVLGQGCRCQTVVHCDLFTRTGGWAPTAG